MYFKIKNIGTYLCLSIFLLSVTLCVIYHNKYSIWYEKKLRKCIVVSKYVEQYNATPNMRGVDIRYKNVFVLRSNDYLFKLDVEDRAYYTIPINSIAYFNVSIEDMNMIPIKKIIGISYHIDAPYIIFMWASIISTIILILIHFFKEKT